MFSDVSQSLSHVLFAFTINQLLQTKQFALKRQLQLERAAKTRELQMRQQQ
jgi:hypothetical protein